MDTTRVNQGEFVAGVSGVLLFLFLFLHWSGGVDLWKQADVIDVVLALIALGTAVLALLPMTGQEVALPGRRPRIIVTLGIIATTIVFTVLLESDDLNFGIFLSALAAIGIILGGYLAEGGRPLTTARPPGPAAAAPGAPAAPPPSPPPAGPPGSEPPPRG